MFEPVVIGDARIYLGDNREVLCQLDDNSVDSCVCDPPYEIDFMGKGWDRSGIAYDGAVWREVFRVLKPGGYLLAASHCRTYHRVAVAIEDAGFEIRDMFDWIYGSGFPKSSDAARAIARHCCTLPGRHYERELPAAAKRKPDDHICQAVDLGAAWEGWGSALKPAKEPFVMARKPLIGTIAETLLACGTGAINIDGCRIPAEKETGWSSGAAGGNTWNEGNSGLCKPGTARPVQGRFPANIAHDGSDEVLRAFPMVEGGGHITGTSTSELTSGIFGLYKARGAFDGYNDDGSAARFFYCAKATIEDREAGLEGMPALRPAAAQFRPNHAEKAEAGEDGNPYGRFKNRRNIHPTVKPLDLMRYLVRLVTPKGGVVLDPFMGSGSTGKAARYELCRFIGIDIEPAYVEIARRRMAVEVQSDLLRFAQEGVA